jgi:hypothetical protein
MGAWRKDGRAGLVVLAALSLLLPACDSTGNFTVLGYTTRPNYNPDIRTVRVPIFKNDTFYKGLEFDLTEALIREIELKTPYKVVPAWENADTELRGTIVAGTKSIVLLGPLGEPRDAETTLSVQIVWRDLRPGCLGDGLTNPAYQPTPPVPTPSPAGLLPGMPGVPADDVPALGVPITPYNTPLKPLPPPPVPAGAVAPFAPPPAPAPTGQPDRVLVQSMWSFRPELGESLTTSNYRMVQRMARQITQMMETPY